MAAIFGPDALKKLPNDHALYRAFFTFDKGPPATSFELNGWGDDLVHDYLRGIEIDGRLAVSVLEQGLWMRMGLRLPQQALPRRGQYEVRSEYCHARNDHLKP